MASKACFEDFCEKFSEKLIGDNGVKGYDCSCALFFGELTSCKFENWNWIFKFTYMDNIAGYFTC